MDAFSVVSLTSLTTTISNRALSSATELNELLQALGRDHLASEILFALSNALHRHQQQVAQLQAALDGAHTISVRLQAHLSQSLTACDATAAVLNKQVMRLQPDNVELFDESFCAAHGDAVRAYSQLFDVFVKLLSMDDMEAQDAALDTNESAVCFDQVHAASNKASESRDIIQDVGSLTHSLTPNSTANHNEPPPYEPAGSSSSQSAAGPSSPSSGFAKGMSSLTSSFKAMTSNLWPKPDPLATAFCQAALRGDVVQMKGFLAQGGNINGRNGDGNTPLTCAIMADKEEAVQFLLSSGVDVSSRDGSKLPPVFLAASAGSIDAVRLLISKGADVNQKSWSGQSYFTDVVSSENVKGIQVLLEHGASANATNISGRPVIAQAVKKGNIELATLLLRHGADVGSYDISGNSLIALAAGQLNLEMARLLLAYGANASGRTLTGNTMVVDALNKRRIDLATLLLDHGADANGRDLYGSPILITVIRDTKLSDQERLETARLLLSHGAHANASDSAWSVSALPYAMETGPSELVRLLLQHGAATDKKMSGGETMLLYALDRGKGDQVKMLIEHGADVNAADKKGRTPLTQAIAKVDMDLIRLLRRHGANVSLGGFLSPAELAPAMNNFEMLRLLGLEIPSVPPVQAGGESRGAANDEAGPARSHSPPPRYDKAVAH
ncbi:ankyrin repeat-containing domain protein [Dactylonectria estremocensis]|uniref:Ankyrin repeat-containing domain protein n=1 Tax=Dactylonectria estremocensis TaxID=1079267 RepID=A0A9P9F250_9HYPO|nr:ankyrin repeat-containing domain protein [Dactylonectria estremocensis]